MPTYDYVCNACGHEFELFQSMTDSVKKKCPECNKRSLERLIGTGAGVIFKGSGFYETDYRSDSYHKAAEAEKNNGTSKKSKDDSKSKDSSDSSKSKSTKSASDASVSNSSSSSSSKSTNGKKSTSKSTD